MEASTIAPGTQIEQFQLLRLLGRGGMGEVYLARDVKLGRKVALKLIHEKLSRRKSLRESFLFEAQATARFNHPHIVTIYEVGEFRQRPFVALEYLPGENLRERLRDEGFSLAESLRILRAVALGLQEAHKHQMLHRDLKPENIFLPKDGRIRVLDFGLAQEVTGTSEHSDKGIVGTPSYMAPEQWRRDPLSEATDIWAFGAIAFELFVGRRPFPSGAAISAPRELEDDPLLAGLSPSMKEIACEVLSSDPAPRLSDDDFPEGLCELVALCMDKQPQRRPSIEEILQSLQHHLTEISSLELEQHNPFRGLNAFREEHAPFFFGRETEVATFLEHLRVQALLPILGSSGAGKSSFVRAGIIPRLKERGNWQILSMRPGPRPFYTLSSLLEQARWVVSPALKTGEGPRFEVSSVLSIEEMGEVPDDEARGFEDTSLLEGDLDETRVESEVEKTEVGISAALEETILPDDEPSSPSKSPSRSFEYVEEPDEISQPTEPSLGLTYSWEGKGVTRTESPGYEQQRHLKKRELTYLAALYRHAPSMIGNQLRRQAAERGRRILLFIDQFEELFTLCDDAREREQFVQALVHAADDPDEEVRVVLTMRSDFLDRWGAYPELREAMGQMTFLRPPDARMLEEIIMGPLQLLGYEFDDPSLLGEILSSLESEHASLPLLQFALSLMWERRDRESRLLRRRDYEEMGGVGGALARHAERLLEGLDTREVQLVQSLLLRLVTSEGTRRVLSRSKLLAGLEAEASALLDRLIDSRLLNVRKQTTKSGQSGAVVEVAHESLLTNWEQLARWIHISDQTRAQRDEIEEATRLWLQRGSRTSELWAGDALQDALRFLSNDQQQLLTPEAQRFVKEAERKHQEFERRERRKTQMIIAALSGFVLFLAVVAVGFYSLWDDAKTADARRQRAHEEMEKKRRKFQRDDMRDSLRLREALPSKLKLRRYVRGRILRELQRKKRGLKPREDPKEHLWRQWAVKVRQKRLLCQRSLSIPSDAEKLTAFFSGRRWLLLLSPQWRGRFDLFPGRKSDAFSCTLKSIPALAPYLRPGGLGWSIEKQRWMRSPHAERRYRRHLHKIQDLALRPTQDDLLLLHVDRPIARPVTRKAHIIWYHLHKRSSAVIPTQITELQQMLFHPKDRSFLLLGRGCKAKGGCPWLIEWWGADRKLKRRLSRPGPTATSVAWSPRRDRLLTGHADGSLRAWSWKRFRLVRRFSRRHARPVASVGFRGKETLLSAHQGGDVYAWNPNRPHPRLLLRIPSEPNTRLFLWDRGRQLLSLRLLSHKGQRRLRFRRWLLTEGGPSYALRHSTGSIRALAFHPRDPELLAARDNGWLQTWSLRTGQVVELRKAPLRPQRLTICADGKRAMLATQDGHMRVWELAGPSRLQMSRFQRGAQWFFVSSHSVLSLAAPTTATFWELHSKKPHLVEWHPLTHAPSTRFLPATANAIATEKDGKIQVWFPKIQQAKSWDIPELHSARLEPGGKGIYTLEVRRATTKPAGKKPPPYLLRYRDQKGNSRILLELHSLPTQWTVAPKTRRIALLWPGRGLILSELPPKPPKSPKSPKPSKSRRASKSPSGVRKIPLIGVSRSAPTSLRFHPNGQLLAAGSLDGSLRVWHSHSGRPLWYTRFVDRAKGWVLTHRGWERPGASPASWLRRELPTRSRLTRALEKAWRADANEPFACLWTDGVGRGKGRLELWSRSQDRRLNARPMARLRQVQATPQGCLLLGSQGDSGVLTAKGWMGLTRETDLIRWHQGHYYAVSQARVLKLDAAGQPQALLLSNNGQQISALMRMGQGLFLGAFNGNYTHHSLIRDLHRDSAYQGFQTHAHLRRAAISAFLQGPQKTAFVGFSDGVVLGYTVVSTSKHKWPASPFALKSPFYRKQLHGPVRRLQWLQGRLVMVTELGDVHSQRFPELRKPLAEAFELR